MTGGAGAIGGAIVDRLTPHHTVVVLDRSGDIVVDLADTDDVRRAADTVLERYGRCDVLIHAAAMVGIEAFDELGLGTWRRVQAVNVESPLLLTQALVPGMRSRGFGRVVFVASNTFWNPPGAHMLAYIASKGALIGMTRALAVGLGGDGIAVTAVGLALRTRRPPSASRRPSSPMPSRTRPCHARSPPTTPQRPWRCSSETTRRRSTGRRL